jgi:hypothetical protein
MKQMTPNPTDSNVTPILFPWFALQVRTRQEASVGDQLNGQGYERFLPLYKARKRWSDRIKEVETPLFPGYLFCRFDPRDRLPIFEDTRRNSDHRFQGWTQRGRRIRNSFHTEAGRRRSATSALAVFIGWRPRKN